MTISAPEGKVITKIVINGIKTSDIKDMTSDKGIYEITSPNKFGTWTGNAKEVVFTTTKTIAMTSIDVTLTTPSYDYAWNDTEDNVIPNEDNKTVKIKRSVVKDEYNTICLPFDIVGAEEIAATFGEGTKVYEFYSAEVNTLTFIDTDVIETGTAYLLKPTETKNEIVYTGTIYGSEELFT